MSTFINQEDLERKTLLILRVLNEAGGPLGSRIIARRMKEMGVATSERAVRYHLKFMDERGLTKFIDRHDGRMITELGVDELNQARVRDKVGLAISRIEALSFRTSFNPDTKEGLIPINVSLFRKPDLARAMAVMGEVFDRGLVVSALAALAQEGEKLGEFTVPEDMWGAATVCSIVVNGVMLKAGIPMDSKFGGILQIRDGIPVRFTELIHYSGSSIDPSEVFIRGNMTMIGNAISDGKGTILANFREIPAICRSLAVELINKLHNAGINGVVKMGKIGEAVCEVPVDLNKIGVILMGGLNPAARVREVGIEVENHSMCTVIDYGDLKPFAELYQAVK